MANKANQKLKLLYILEMLRQKTDENHPISTKDVIAELARYDIEAERKSIYRDIEILQEAGVDVIKAERNAGYYMGSREFELPELKLLVDAVLACKFITEKKSKELVNKIETLGSVYQGKELQRQVVVSDRVKAGNEGIYYTIDVIYNCINNNHRLNFKYVNWNTEKKLEYQHDGQVYEVSPEFLLWDSEYYYLVAYDHKADDIRHYRVDKMRAASENDETRGGSALRKKLKKSDYSKKHFGMFSGESREVTMRAPKSLTGVLIDRFGTGINLRTDNEDVIVRTEVEVSAQFYGWLVGLGGSIRPIYPEDVVADYKKYLQDVINNI